MSTIETLRRAAACAAAGAVLLWAAESALAAEEVTGAEVVQRCELDKDPGEDQKSTLTVILRDAQGNERRSIYRRYWKAYHGKRGLQDKMVIFTRFPADQRGTAFMRWGYLPEKRKPPEQWLYLPSLNTVRRVSQRDPADSFLTSDLAYWDINDRRLEDDEHRLLRVEEKDGATYYVVESVPKERDAPYSKRVQWFRQGEDGWDGCVKTRIEYYGPSGSLVKTQDIEWQQVSGAWVWKRVEVENVKTHHRSIFEVSDVEVNTGLRDRVFTERTLRRGVRD